MGISGSKGSSAQQSSQASTGYSATDIWGQQIPGLAQLYTQGMNLARQQQQPAHHNAERFVQQMFPAARQAVSGLQGIGAGRSPIEQYATPNNALAAQQLQAMSGEISQNFARQIMPQLQGGAGLAGGLGQSRHMLAQGVAAGDAARQIANAGTNLYSQQYQIGANAAAGATDARLAALQAVPQAASQAFNLGMSPYQASWAPISALAQILGDPTILSRSAQGSLGQSSGQSKNSGFGFQLF